ncbi:hypothetical protein ERC79_14455 [Rhodococcus sp. ABRD24]|uniref:hypothetical protein n=1 Tax=Rhodococcus sp. ABRD24 TaxID=2507582 RepID=UPI00103AE045|nr:hypothetical protein [Rhodococcus sp. ABRD24]QBJ97019.1 hypothetical protein ERC79_14455 [Rhodococcus sp. ABRD24]
MPASSWITRPETADDISAVRNINLAAFGTAEEADLEGGSGFTRASLHGIRLSIDVPDEVLLALVSMAGLTPPSGAVRYAPPFGI